MQPFKRRFWLRLALELVFSVLLYFLIFIIAFAKYKSSAKFEYAFYFSVLLSVGFSLPMFLFHFFMETRAISNLRRNGIVEFPVRILHEADVDSTRYKLKKLILKMNGRLCEKDGLLIAYFGLWPLRMKSKLKISFEACSTSTFINLESMTVVPFALDYGYKYRLVAQLATDLRVKEAIE